MIITIDGPTASGKSTLARELAQKLGYYYIYSGLMFRALAYLLHTQYEYSTEQFANPRRADIDAILDPKQFIYTYDVQHKERILFGGVDITAQLKQAVVDQWASLASMNQYVRKKIEQMQRLIAQSHDVVVDGRDAGSVVFSQADYKLYLTASEQERAQRWLAQQAKYGTHRSFNEAVEFIHERDERDAQRNHAPLKIPQGAHVIDNTGKTIAETLAAVCQLLGIQ